MADGQISGTLQMTGGPGAPGEVREAAFGTLQELLALCCENEGAAFIRVEIRGSAGGGARRLVLDFAQFNPKAA